MTHDKHQSFFDLLASEWDLMFTAEDLERLEHIVSKIDVQPDTEIIDLGCGTGVLFDMLRRRVGPGGSVTGVDFSLSMALKAHRNFPFSNVNVVDADVALLPFKESSFDLGVAFGAFAHFSQKESAIAEIHRVLKPGSKLYIIHLCSSKELAEMHHRLGGVLEHDELPPEDELRRMFNGNRFTDVSIDDHPGLFLATGTNVK